MRLRSVWRPSWTGVKRALWRGIVISCEWCARRLSPRPARDGGDGLSAMRWDGGGGLSPVSETSWQAEAPCLRQASDHPDFLGIEGLRQQRGADPVLQL